METTFMKLLYMTEKKHDVVLATVIAKTGSAPCPVGAQMLVADSGRVIGTIGGGAVEFRAEELAQSLLDQKQSAVHTFPLHEHDTDDIGMVCGGDVTVLLQYVAWDDPYWNTLSGKVVDLLSAHQHGWLIFNLNGTHPSLIDENYLPLCGSLTNEVLLQSKCLLLEHQFIMPLPIGERAILFGAGHCSRALAPLLSSVGFRVVVFDDRAAQANAENFPIAEQIIVGDFQQIQKYLTLEPTDYAVVMTSGHSYDFQVQQQILRQKLAYVGVIGSRAKKASVNERLRQVGISDDALYHVHSPVGTPIKAVTPQEIAISIAGEMIYVRACNREQL